MAEKLDGKPGEATQVRVTGFVIVSEGIVPRIWRDGRMTDGPVIAQGNPIGDRIRSVLPEVATTGDEAPLEERVERTEPPHHERDVTLLLTGDQQPYAVSVEDRVDPGVIHD